MMDADAPKGAATGLDPSLTDAVPDPGRDDQLKAVTGVPEGMSKPLQEARMADDLQRIRRRLDVLGPMVLGIAYFAALATLFLAMIYYRRRP